MKYNFKIKSVRNKGWKLWHRVTKEGYYMSKSERAFFNAFKERYMR